MSKTSCIRRQCPTCLSVATLITTNWRRTISWCRVVPYSPVCASWTVCNVYSWWLKRMTMSDSNVTDWLVGWLMTWCLCLMNDCRSVVRRCSEGTVKTWSELSWRLPAHILHPTHRRHIPSRHLSQLEGASNLLIMMLCAEIPILVYFLIFNVVFILQPFQYKLIHCTQSM